MKPSRSTPITERKLARLIACAWLTLAWIGAALFADAVRIDRRHIRRRYFWLDLDRIAYVVACLVVARAGQLKGQRKPPPPKRDYAPAGFRRRIRRGHGLRSLFGSALRKALQHPSIAQRYARIVRALAHIDTLARRLLRRLKRGVSRLCPILPVRPPRARAHGPAAPCPVAFADSS